MIIPNKVITFEESVIGKITFILDVLTHSGVHLSDLFHKVADKFEDLDQFILALDVLYLLDKIRYDDRDGVVKIC